MDQATFRRRRVNGPALLSRLQHLDVLDPHRIDGHWIVRHYYLSADHQIWFFTLYDKDEATDLTTEEKKALKKAIQAELEARRRKP
jgi:hypothetical protein